MKTTRKLLAGFMALALSSGAALAADTVVLPDKDVTFDSSDKLDNVFILGKATFSGALVKGDITVYPGGKLETEATLIRGGIVAEGASHVIIDEGTFVRGNVHITKATAVVEIWGAGINGDLRINNNQVRWIDVWSSDIRGDVRIRNNRVRDEIWLMESALGNYALVDGNSAGEIDVSDNVVLNHLDVLLNAAEYLSVYGNYGGGDCLIDENTCFDLDISDDWVDGTLEISANWAWSFWVYDNVAENVDIYDSGVLSDLDVWDNYATYLWAWGNTVLEDVSVDGNEAEDIDFADNWFLGDVQVSWNCGYYLWFWDTYVAGDTWIEDNCADDLDITGNTLRGDLVFNRNQASTAEVAQNMIGGDFQALQNDPCPDTYDNWVRGSTDTDCVAGLILP